MRLRALTGLEKHKIEAELGDLQIKITELQAILSDKKRLLTVIKEEITVIADKYGDDRKTEINLNAAEGEIDDETLIQEEDAVVAMTKKGYIKRMSLDNFRA